MITIKKYTSDEWKMFSKEAHESCFTERWEPLMERIDFALLAVNEQNIPIGYTVIQERNKDEVYLQYGGMFPEARGTFATIRAFYAMLQELKSYKTITTLVENKNFGMLKLYLSARFLVTGIRYYKNTTYLENTYHVPCGTPQ